MIFTYCHKHSYCFVWTSKNPRGVTMLVKEVGTEFENLSVRPFLDWCQNNACKTGQGSITLSTRSLLQSKFESGKQNAYGFFGSVGAQSYKNWWDHPFQWMEAFGHQSAWANQRRQSSTSGRFRKWPRRTYICNRDRVDNVIDPWPFYTRCFDTNPRKAAHSNSQIPCPLPSLTWSLPSDSLKFKQNNKNVYDNMWKS